MFNFELISLLFAIFRVPPFTIWLKQQQFVFIVIILYTFPRTAIILFTRNVSSHKTDWILSEFPLSTLSCLLHHRVSSLKNAHNGECLCLREIYINVNKFIVICVFCLRCPCSVVVACLLVYSFFFILMLLYFSLFVDHVNKFIVLFLELLFIILITPLQNKQNKSIETILN